MRKLYFLPLLVVIFVTQIFSQDKPKARKFDEFESAKTDLTTRANRFAQQVVKEKQARAFIIFYNQRKKTEDRSFNGYRDNDYARGVLINGYEIPAGKIISINGGFRENSALEFWIAPDGAEVPLPTPTFDRSEVIVCPQFDVAGVGFRHDRNQPLNFSVAVRDGDETPAEKLSFEWNVSGGTIAEGQGTNQIKIDLSETKATRIAAAVTIKGLAPECNNYAVAATEVGLFPYAFGSFDSNYSYMAALLDGLVSALQNEPQMRGHIIVYGMREGVSGGIQRTMKSASTYLTQMRGLDPERFSVVSGGYREQARTEMFLLAPGVEPPAPTLTVDEKFVIFTDKKTIQRKTKRARQRNKN